MVYPKTLASSNCTDSRQFRAFVSPTHVLDVFQESPLPGNLHLVGYSMSLDNDSSQLVSRHSYSGAATWLETEPSLISSMNILASTNMFLGTPPTVTCPKIGLPAPGLVLGVMASRPRRSAHRFSTEFGTIELRPRFRGGFYLTFTCAVVLPCSSLILSAPDPTASSNAVLEMPTGGSDAHTALIRSDGGDPTPHHLMSQNYLEAFPGRERCGQSAAYLRIKSSGPRRGGG